MSNISFTACSELPCTCTPSIGNEVSSERTTSIPPHSDHDDTASNSVDMEEWCGFRLVGDNIDKTVGPRDMRVNHQSQSLHYFHVYSVKDRVDVRHLSPSVTKHSPGDVDVNKFLPCAEVNEAACSISFQSINGKGYSKSCTRSRTLIAFDS